MYVFEEQLSVCKSDHMPERSMIDLCTVQADLQHDGGQNNRVYLLDLLLSEKGIV